MGHVGTDIHEVGDAVTALSLGIALEKFTYLEEEHHEDSLQILRLGIRQETDAEGTDGSHRHQQVLVECLALRDTFPCLVERLVSD